VYTGRITVFLEGFLFSLPWHRYATSYNEYSVAICIWIYLMCTLYSVLLGRKIYIVFELILQKRIPECGIWESILWYPFLSQRKLKTFITVVSVILCKWYVGINRFQKLRCLVPSEGFRNGLYMQWRISQTFPFNWCSRCLEKKTHPSYTDRLSRMRSLSCGFKVH
jgi:hypothetical protein